MGKGGDGRESYEVQGKTSLFFTISSFRIGEELSNGIGATYKQRNMVYFIYTNTHIYISSQVYFIVSL